MKIFLLSIALTGSTLFCFGQSQFISYEDVNFLLHNNLMQADTFLTAKGYTTKVKDDKKRTREYVLAIPGGTHVDITMRADGKRLFIDLESNESRQYNLVINSVSQYINKASSTVDMQTYVMKDLCTIYITWTEGAQFDPLRRAYDMQIVADKNVTAYN